MSRIANTLYEKSGTRFRVYPQPKILKDFAEPEIVYINAVPGTIKPGPEDEGIYVIDAIDKVAYKDSAGWPPYTGPRHPGAAPDSDGHFDHIKPGTRAFSSAAVFATVRFVLDIWERYFGRRLPWYFRDTYPRLEVIPRVEADNAWSRFGYLECGYPDFPKSRANPFCENFDVVAHEVGHCICRQVIGNPGQTMPAEYRAHDEAAADLIAMVSSLHFSSVVRHLLERTQGDLFSENVLSRIGELGKTTQIRKAFNSEKMSTVHWDADPLVYKYRLSRPFTGGAFDVLVEIYLHGLIERKAVPTALAERSVGASHRHISATRQEFRTPYAGHAPEFREALLEAREYFGRLVARTWDKTPLDNLSYPAVVANMVAADAELSGGKYGRLIRQSFQWREILPVDSG